MSTAHAFSGSVPENYDRYLVPMIFDGYACSLAERVRLPPGGALLETACGTGAATRHLLDVLPQDGTLVATDLQEAMVSHSKAALDDERLEVRVADALALPFETDSFDAVASAFGVMFFPDRLAGYRETLRVLKPGGSFVASIWDSHAHNDFCRLVHETLVGIFPDDPPVFLTIPFAYSDLNQIASDFQAAGFGDVEIAVQKRECTCPYATDVPNGFLLGNPVISEILDRTDDVDAIANVVTQAVTDLYGETDCRSTMQALIVTARAPESSI